MDSSSSKATAALMVAAASTLASALAGALWYYDKKQKVESPIFPGIPSAPGAHWLLGHIILLAGDGDFFKGYKTVYEEFADPESGLCSLWFLSVPCVSVLLSHHVKAVLNASSFRNSVKWLEEHDNHFLGPKALTALMGKEWKLYRSAVHRSFTPGALKQSQQSINRVGNTLVQSLLAAIEKRRITDGAVSEEKQKPALKQPLLPLMKMATMDVFGLAALDVDFACCQQLKLTEVASAFEYLASEYTRRLSTPWDISSWLYALPTPANRKHHQQRGIIRTFILNKLPRHGENLLVLMVDNQQSKICSPTF